MTLENLRQYQEGVMLGDWEASRTVRVRGPIALFEALKGRTPTEVGELLTAALKAQDQEQGRALDSAPGMSLEGVERLTVAAVKVPPALRNKLRWEAEKYASLEGKLAAGPELVRDVTNGKERWVTAAGQTIRRDTVQRLLAVGVLVPA